MATAALNPDEEAQLSQTIEMFEVIVQSQPGDTQSLEILKEAYTKLGREQEVVSTSKRIAQAYLQQGQLSSAILEYETVLQHRPDDADVRTALKQIEDRAGGAVMEPSADSVSMTPGSDTVIMRRKARSAAAEDVDNGRRTMYRIFVESKLITAGDFDLCWQDADLTQIPADPVNPFIQTLHEKGILTTDKSMRLISDKSRVAYLPLDRYDVDIDLTRGFPSDVCRRWCVLPFDRMSKAILVATANPFNQQAAKELSGATTHRLLWYLASPNEIIATLRKAFR
jgi:tetratricopeptide (TPR) repeat protein